ncbi:hypothetical protein [Manganibacter manganicus]|uniref:Lipoprotein n=1 Tax=Manganibacter manganicus TaxID=1873176 RepID=A0A1V8RUF6_9HYPH|nr:hypothetical protein [Pseudaminobacter manganicus]OQM76795.1 hypothetical protein BFN67_12880 [Pseudaminobacter manganicus]
MKRVASGIACLLAATITGCAISPAEYAATLSTQDPKWRSPQCEQARQQAAEYDAGEKDNLDWAAAPLFGPYGVALVTTIKEQEQKQRKRYSREVHLQCSSLPLPDELQAGTGQSTRAQATKYP